MKCPYTVSIAEASNGGTGLQEEWGDLTFHNTNLSTENQPSNSMDSTKQETS